MSKLFLETNKYTTMQVIMLMNINEVDVKKW